MKQTDYLIIGAGIVGCSTAYFLSKQNKKVTVVDRTYPCNEASGVNAGGLELLQQPPESLPLHKQAADLWYDLQFNEGIDVGYIRSGGLYVIMNEADLVMLDEQEERFAVNEMEVHRLDKKKVLEMIPCVCPDDIIAANYSPKSGQSNPLKSGRNILKAAMKNGVEFVSQTLIEKIEPSQNGDGYDAFAGEEVFHAKKVLVCCGCRSPKLLDPLGEHIDIDRHHNMITVTEKAPHFLDYTFTTPTLTLKQTAEGSFLIGGGREGYGDLETNRKDVSINNLCFNVREATTIVPSLSRLNILRSWSGFEGFTPERLPYMGECRKFPGVYYAVTGFCGYAIGPAVGYNTCKMLLDEEFIRCDVTPELI